MVDSKPRNTTLKKLARWTPSSSPSGSERRIASIPPLSNDAPFVHVHHDKLQQGSLYIIKIKQVSLAMFEGWNDDMCCFSVLRSEVEPLRWSEARQLPGDFDIYDAFDESGNPPIHLWTRFLKVPVPHNWFTMFEEAKRKQRDWALRQQQQQQLRQSLIQQQQQNNSGDYYYSPPLPQSEVDGLPVTYSNTDVSTMSLNHHRHHPNESVVSPSIVASTNIVDPSLMNDDIRSQTITQTGLSHQPSMISTTSYVTNNTCQSNRVLSPTPSSSHKDIIQQQHQSPSQSERTNSIMDREQIRRHLAPGQAISQVTLNSQPSTPVTTRESPTKLVHHRSKELVNNGIPEEAEVTPSPAQQQQVEEVKKEVKNNEENKDINHNGAISSSNIQLKQQDSISVLSSDLEFPHDSDSFSIRSDIAAATTAVTSPNMKPSSSSKSRNSRPSMKKIIWG